MKGKLPPGFKTKAKSSSAATMAMEHGRASLPMFMKKRPDKKKTSGSTAMESSTGGY